MEQNTLSVEVGDVVKAGSVFSGTVVKTNGDRVFVENRDGDVEQFSHKDLKHTC